MNKHYINPLTGEEIIANDESLVVDNIFCPTGPGGGRDATCSAGSKGPKMGADKGGGSGGGGSKKNFGGSGGGVSNPASADQLGTIELSQSLSDHANGMAVKTRKQRQAATVAHYRASKAALLAESNTKLSRKDRNAAKKQRIEHEKKAGELFRSSSDAEMFRDVTQAPRDGKSPLMMKSHITADLSKFNHGSDSVSDSQIKSDFSKMHSKYGGKTSAKKKR